ncbi:MAG TPA: threonine synthase [Gemmatimonadales bacterium]|nr:threonine synthase [Gemmatimonadales bacterium]
MRFHTERPASWQSCLNCGNEVVETDPRTRCALCHGLLDIQHRPPEVTAAQLIQRFSERRNSAHGASTSGVWRFREIVLPSVDTVVSHPEGNTPLLHRVSLDRWTGVDQLLLKHEGANPTGSFKDRGMTVGVTQALRIGANAVACASTGNTSASLAAYAAQAALPALVVVPSAGVAIGKLAQTLAYGARTLLVRGDFDQCLRLIEEASEKLGVYLLNSINPFRIEGQKTVIFELLEQLSWDAPDWIVFPAGNLGNTAAFGKALREAHEWGLVPRRSRLAAVQAEGAAPFALSFAEQFAHRHRVKAETVATAIKIGDPASYERGVTSIRETDGVVLSVPDSELLEAKAVIDASGVGCEPASAASVAGIRRLVRDGTVQPEERVVAILTGHILKDPGLLLKYHQETTPPPPRANRPVEIEADLRALEQILQGHA